MRCVSTARPDTHPQLRLKSFHPQMRLEFNRTPGRGSCHVCPQVRMNFKFQLALSSLSPYNLHDDGSTFVIRTTEPEHGLLHSPVFYFQEGPLRFPSKVVLCGDGSSQGSLLRGSYVAKDAYLQRFLSKQAFKGTASTGRVASTPTTEQAASRHWVDTPPTHPALYVTSLQEDTILIEISLMETSGSASNEPKDSATREND
ncbi:hypothetical protein EGW08_002623 [Elysia chlorotica]|uniref:Uncharacterized protein n=1 Tax=Elysia chlorotica TaxID=188477 RepID=A0A3S1BV82_ELYCH|nr:hypothetical protein EGW08_002623 [Elysia chlorotica]